MFFSFDGLDGVGKSTQLELFCDWLRAGGREVVACCDPGSTALGERLREILLERGAMSIARTSEMLLFMSARAQLVDEVIRPALAAGRAVVSDRYLLANVVYQGYAGGLDVDAIWSIGSLATAGIQPDLTFVLDMPLEVARARIARPLDHMEREALAFQERLRHGFLVEAARRPNEIAVVDASGPVEAVQAEIRRLAQRVLDNA